ncbi:hypothetical protein ACIQBJ_20410 [Kitasatospora sp. NPDC088391]|uniref:hypothetical protein n=1 Tax=Kitasatospora sp. NPDC088391 TaxID=3364074 RepID=UPI00380BCAAA
MRTRPTVRRPLSGRLPAVLAVLLAVLLGAIGCSAAGGLEDAGATRPVRAHPSPLPLWPDAAAVAPATAPQVAADLPAPVPLPGLAVDSLTAVDARTVLAKDPELGPGERAALDGGCPGCAVRDAQYRDLDGDGSPELLTAVLTGADAGRAVLHVYRLRGRDVLPVLSLTALPGFTAETVGADLVVHEPTGQAAETSSTYRWNGVRLAFADRRIKATGPGQDVPGCPPEVAAVPSPVPSRPAVAPFPAATAAPVTRGETARPTPTRTR